jgi:hypothetical protein
MNEDWMTELEPRAGDELERKLDRYARLRLDPSPGQARRARSGIMEAAWRQKLDGRSAGTSSADDTEPSVAAASLTVMPAPGAQFTPADRAPFAGWGPKRLGVSFAAAVLAGLMVGGSVFAGSRAGGQLYATRVAVEELTMPTDARARVEAELALAQGRLAEIVESVAKGDRGATAASVAAYLSTLDELEESTGGPADRALVAIQQHRAVLEQVLDQVPDQARFGIENALLMSAKVVEHLNAVATPVPAGAGTGSGSGSGGRGSASGGGGSDPNVGAGGNANAGGGNANAGGGNPNAGGGNPNAEPGANSGGGTKPAATPKPDRTARPTRPPRPARTPAPDATAAPTPRAPQGGKP